MNSLLTRRSALMLPVAQSFAMTVAHSLWTSELSAQPSAQPSASRKPLNRFPRMVQEYFVAQVREAEARRLRIFDNLKTKADAESYVKSIRGRLQQCFGPFPEKTPLNARVTSKVERDEYVIENIVFESRPGFFVTANLYVPKGIDKPRPGVVGSCGHSATGKAGETYQSFAQGLARLGYVCLIFDPIGQGERLQYLNDNLKPKIGIGVSEHLKCGNQQYLVGESFASWRAWDGIRALDYLLTRPEVDPNQVGITGNSGGGTMATWLCAVDSRWTMAAPSCFVTTWRRNMENELPQDTEQCPPRMLALGLDHEDCLAALAPKPVIILAKEKDYFDVRGSEEAHGRLKKLYSLLGAEENAGLFVGPTHHGFSIENREAMYRWFNGATKISDAQSEPKLTIEKDEVLWAAPEGQVARMDSHTVPGLTKATSQKLRESRKPLSGDKLKSEIQSVLKLSKSEGIPDYRILRAMRGHGYPKPHALTYLVETDPGIQAIVTALLDEAHYSRPPRLHRKAVLYVSHHSADVELRDEPLVREILAEDPAVAFYACDVRGIGDSQPDTCGTNTFLNPYGSDYFYASYAVMLDRPYSGQRTFDLLRVLSWLKSNGHEDIHLVARGWGAIPATFAAVLSNDVQRVTLKNALTSYSDAAETELYDWPLSAFVPGILTRFDLPDCYAALERKQLKQIDPWGGKRS